MKRVLRGDEELICCGSEVSENDKDTTTLKTFVMGTARRDRRLQVVDLLPAAQLDRGAANTSNWQSDI